MTPQQLADATGCQLLTAARVLPFLEAAMKEFDITTPARRAGFIAQCAHESNFHARREDLTYRPERLMVVWPSRFPTLASTRAFAFNPEALANHVYADRMGNGPEFSGDGFKFRGGGWLQATGRQMYYAIGQRLGISLMSEPERIMEDSIAARSAGYIWAVDKGCNALMDAGDFDATSRAINLGNAHAKGVPIGNEHRQQLFARLSELATA